MDADAFFSRNVSDARGKFLTACRAQRLLPQAYRWPSDPTETALPLVDSVRVGDPAARRMLVVCGGDHQADALCCSAVVVGWLSEFAGKGLPRDTAVLLLQHGAAPPTGGEPASADVPPPAWEDDLLAKAEERYAEYARRKGVDSLGAPLAGAGAGLAGYPAGVLDAVAKWLDSAADGRIAIVDIRVGLGPFGEAEITPCHPPDTTAARRVQAWFGLPDPPDGAQTAPQEPDSLATGLIRRQPDAEITAFSAAFGTYSMMSVLESLAARPAGDAVPDTRQILFPDDSAWRAAVWRSATRVIQRTLTALRAD